MGIIEETGIVQKVQRRCETNIGRIASEIERRGFLSSLAAARRKTIP